MHRAAWPDLKGWNRTILLVAAAVAALLALAGGEASAVYSSEAEFRNAILAHPNWAVIPQWAAMPLASVNKAELRSKLGIFRPFGYNEDWVDGCNRDGVLVVQPGDEREWAVPRGIDWAAPEPPLRPYLGYDLVQLQYVFKPGVTLHVFKTSSRSYISKVCGNPSPIVYIPPGTLSVKKFDDTNMNGQWDGDEVELAGWAVCYSGPESQCGMTRLVVAVSAGTYSVSEELVDGWLATTPTSVARRVRSNHTSTVQFGNVELAEISGIKWDDTNCDGVKDEDEEVLAGWEITLTGRDIAGDEVTREPILTDSDGFYEFKNLPPSDTAGYTISETLAGPEAWGPTTPLDPIPDPLPDPVAPQSYTVVLEEGADVTEVDFGNVQLGSISGFKFYDANGDLPPDDPRNGNGSYDEGEPLLTDWTFRLNGKCDLHSHAPESYAGLEERVVLTDGSGVFMFSRLYPTHVDDGYTICEDMPEGWFCTWPPDGCLSTHLDEGEEINFGLEFGNLSNPPFDVRTVGYWRNHPEAITKAMYSALSKLPAFKGVSNWKKLQPIFTEANAVDMTAMLRAQLAAMELNVLAGYVPADAWVYVAHIPGGVELFGGNIVYLARILDVVEAAYPWEAWSRNVQETAKDALDHANNGGSLVSPTP